MQTVHVSFYKRLQSMEMLQKYSSILAYLGYMSLVYDSFYCLGIPWVDPCHLKLSMSSMVNFQLCAASPSWRRQPIFIHSAGSRSASMGDPKTGPEIPRESPCDSCLSRKNNYDVAGANYRRLSSCQVFKSVFHDWSHTEPLCKATQPSSCPRSCSASHPP